MTVRGKQQFFNALERLERNIPRYAKDYPENILRQIIVQIIRKDTIDTERFLRNIGYRQVSASGDSFRFQIDTSRNKEVTYDGFVEFDTKNRDGTVRIGRKVYQGGIKASDDDIRRVSDNLMDASFRL